MEAYLDTFYLELESGVGKKCKVIDSRLATKAGTLGNGTIDGIHKKESAGKKWAQDVFPQLF